MISLGGEGRCAYGRNLTLLEYYKVTTGENGTYNIRRGRPYKLGIIITNTHKIQLIRSIHRYIWVLEVLVIAKIQY